MYWYTSVLVRDALIYWRTSTLCAQRYSSCYTLPAMYWYTGVLVRDVLVDWRTSTLCTQRDTY